MWRCIAVLIVTIGLFCYVTYGSYETSSWGVFSDALHTLGDSLPFGLNILVILAATLYEKAVIESLIRKYNFYFLTATAAFLFAAGAWRLAWPVEVGLDVLWFAKVQIVGNAFQLLLARGFERSQILHLLADLVGSIGVYISAWLIVNYGFMRADGSITLVIAVITAGAAWGCTKSGRHFGHHHHAHAGRSHHSHTRH